MTVFWILTGLTAALAGFLVMAGARRGAETVSGLTSDLASRELAELDDLKARGLLDEAGWAAARAEAGRRWLSAGRDARAAPAGQPGDRFQVLAGVVLCVALGLGLYVAVGAPGMTDQPYDRRVDQWMGELATLEAPQIAAVAARVVKDRPGDQEALVMLGTARFEAGDPIGAASAFRRALEIRPDDARSWARLGESLVRSQDGVVGGDAEAAFREALRRDPDQLGARYFLGDAALARGDVAAARTVWAPLIAALEPSDPRRADLLERLAAAGAGR